MYLQYRVRVSSVLADLQYRVRVSTCIYYVSTNIPVANKITNKTKTKLSKVAKYMRKCDTRIRRGGGGRGVLELAWVKRESERLKQGGRIKYGDTVRKFI